MAVPRQLTRERAAYVLAGFLVGALLVTVTVPRAHPGSHAHAVRAPPRARPHARARSILQSIPRNRGGRRVRGVMGGGGGAQRRGGPGRHPRARLFAPLGPPRGGAGGRGCWSPELLSR